MMKDQAVSHQEFEFMIHKKSVKLAKSGFAPKLKQIWNRIVKSMTATNEPTIASGRGKSGNTYWVIHDPLLGCRVFFNSETEVRVWLDKRYYQ